MKREPAKCGGEQDTVTGWRRLLTSFSRSGVARYWKRKINRRARKNAKREMQAEQ